MAELTRKMVDEEREALMHSVGNYQHDLAESIMNGGGAETIESVAKFSVKKPSKIREFFHNLSKILTQ